MKTTIALLFLLGIKLVNAQKHVDLVLNNSCDCVNNYTEEVRDYNDFLQLIMECTAKDMIKYQEELRIELGIKDDGAGALSQVGEKLGERLALTCPRVMDITLEIMGNDDEFMDAALGNYRDQSFTFDEAESEFEVKGRILAVSGEFPCTISLESEEGEVLKILWIYDVILDEEFVLDPDKLIGKNVLIDYSFEDFYDPAKKGYVERKLAWFIEVLEE